MIEALWLLTIQGVIGGFDTLYFHEYRARLPAGGARARPELRLHAARSLIYAVVFLGLPGREWHGAWALSLASLLAAEIAITLADFVVEVRAREPIGVLAGERVTHALMAIVYGAFLSHLLPVWWSWRAQPTALVHAAYAAPGLVMTMRLMGIGVLASGLRDGYASLNLPRSSWPYRGMKA